MAYSKAPAQNVTFSPNARLPACATGANVQVWDAASGEPISTLKGHIGIVRSVSFSVDGSRLVTVDSTGVGKEWPCPRTRYHSSRFAA